MLATASVVLMVVSFIAEVICCYHIKDYYGLFYGYWGKDKIEVLHYLNSQCPIWLCVWIFGTIVSVVCHWVIGTALAFLRVVPGCIFVAACTAKSGTIKASVMIGVSVYANWLMFKVCLCGLLGVLCIMLIYGTIKSVLAKRKEVSLKM